MDEVLLADVLRVQAREQPQQTALIAGDRRITYGELDERSSRLANALRDRGVQPGDRVAHLDQNAPECVELLFATAKLGAVLVPLNWRLTAGELEQVVDDAGAEVLVCAPEFAGSVSAADVLETGPAYEAALAAADTIDPMFASAPDDVILQLYTSGTTGRSKGVLTTNRNLGGLLRASRAWELDAGSVALVAMPLFHIGGIAWTLVALAQGATCTLVRAIVPGDLLDTMERERVTNAFLVPTVLQLLCAIDGAAERDWTAMRSIAYGASSITTTTLRATIETFGCPLFQVYGLTETTGAIVQLDPADHDPGGPREHLLRAAGRPYPWVEVEIVDADGQACAPGDVGEIRVRGATVMAGYFGRDEETRAAFDGDGFLRTGDGGFFDEDGYLYLTDRIKDMVVTGGENVYPIEVEEALATHPDVAEVAVIGTPDERWGEIVTAVVVAREGLAPDAADLVAHARERLAGFKVPRVVHFVDELPKNASGKVLKRELRSVEGSRS